MPEEKPFPFCGCILEAFYTNEMFDTVCVTYTDEHGVNRDWYNIHMRNWRKQLMQEI